VTSAALPEAAMAYAKAGLSIFPCQPRAKLPLGGHGFHDATTDAKRVGQWWDAKRDANIGWACAASEALTIDIDPRHHGKETLAALVAQLGELPETVEAATGGSDGGRHLIFRAPTGTEFRGNLGPGIDIKYNGYILVEPSIHPSGGVYRWIRSPLTHRPAELPSAWIARIAKPSTPIPDSRPQAGSRSAGGSSYGRAAVESELEAVRIALAGERNSTLNAAALKLGSLCAGGEIEDCRDDLILAAMYAGLPESEARRTVESGW
jgi:Bifunctional DNA primase/polymerase, N-terminal